MAGRPLRVTSTVMNVFPFYPKRLSRRGASTASMAAEHMSEGARKLWSAGVAMAVSLLLFPTGTGLGGSLRDVEATVEPGFLSRLQADPTGTFDALVTVRTPLVPETLDLLGSRGLHVLRSFVDLGVVYAEGPGTAFLGLAGLDPVLRVTGNEPLQWFGDTDTVATRARESWDAKSTSTTPVTVGGAVVDGTGVGVAIVDSGVDATHPDLASAVMVSQKFVCSTPGLIHTTPDTCYGNYAAIGDDGCANTFWVPLDDSDTTSGHGTHVAGIVAGRGIASDGRITGAAPGSSLYSLSVGEGLNILFALEAFNWIHCNHAAVSPAIRIVSNSWGISGGSAYSASDPIVVATNQLVADGLVVLFAVGNDGGSGSSNRISGYAKNPTAGVIGVASYNDAGKATRTGSLSTFSSRGGSAETTRTNWPDVSAPGDLITSTLAKTGAVCLPPEVNYLPYYCTISGTSMATPHAAGVVALLLQANSSLTPADVEDVLEDHAVQFTTPGGYLSDSTNPTSGINYGAGHGLVDAIASLADSRVLGSGAGGSPLPQVSQNPHVYAEGLADGQVVRGVQGALVVQWTEVAGRTVSLSERSLTSGNTATYGLSLGQPANFRVDDGSTVTNVADTLTADGSLLQMDADYIFPAPGTYTVEAQIDFGSGLVSFDAFVVRVV